MLNDVNNHLEVVVSTLETVVKNAPKSMAKALKGDLENALYHAKKGQHKLLTEGNGEAAAVTPEKETEFHVLIVDHDDDSCTWHTFRGPTDADPVYLATEGLVLTGLYAEGGTEQPESTLGREAAQLEAARHDAYRMNGEEYGVPLQDGIVIDVESLTVTIARSKAAAVMACHLHEEHYAELPNSSPQM